LQYNFKDFDKLVEILGYRNINAQKAEEFLKTNRKNAQTVEFQFFNAQLIATIEHLYFAVLNSLVAFKNKTNISKSLAMESMLYASAQRQIQKAILRLGIKQNSKELAVIIIGENNSEIKAALESISNHLKAEPDNSVLELTKKKQGLIKDCFQITEEEIQSINKGDIKQAIINLIIEQEALLSTQI
jgi:tRNA threonylcarbamoyladenosine modification (KEOPS) complex Cgi121 subunit